MIEVIAHRGASEDAPENTFASFALAIEQGADMIETDLHLLRSGEIVLHHDAEVEGNSLADLTLTELRELRPDVPTLPEAFAAFAHRIPFNLEIKDSARGEYPRLERRAIDVVRDHEVLERTVFSSFRDSVLHRLREVEPLARIGVLTSRRSRKTPEKRAAAVAAEAVHLNVAQATAKRIEALHAEGLRVRVYTVDDAERQTELIDAGVDGIFTNVPGKLRELLLGRAQ